MRRLTNTNYISLALTLLVCLSLAFGCGSGIAQSSGKASKECVIPIQDLESGVKEVNFGSVRAKLEHYKKTAKMKLVSRLNEDWTSVTLEQGGLGQISGFRGNGDSAELIAELVVVGGEQEIDWAMFVKDSKGLGGEMYFVMDGQRACSRTTVTKWKASVRKVFGEIKNVAYINLDRDQL